MTWSTTTKPKPRGHGGTGGKPTGGKPTGGKPSGTQPKVGRPWLIRTSSANVKTGEVKEVTQVGGIRSTHTMKPGSHTHTLGPLGEHIQTKKAERELRDFTKAQVEEAEASMKAANEANAAKNVLRTADAEKARDAFDRDECGHFDWGLLYNGNKDDLWSIPDATWEAIVQNNAQW
jgi:hypothetical protein